VLFAQRRAGEEAADILRAVSMWDWLMSPVLTALDSPYSACAAHHVDRSDLASSVARLTASRGVSQSEASLISTLMSVMAPENGQRPELYPPPSPMQPRRTASH
jgi:hypothetical protein